MPFVLNNVTTQDNYADATTLQAPQSVKVNLWVSNAAIFVKFSDPGAGQAAPGTAFKPEVFMPPGLYSFLRQTETIAVRSAVAGTPAQVTIEGLTEVD